MTQENSQTRRDVLKKSGLGAATLSLGSLSLSPRSYAQTQGANDRLRVAVLGMKRRGKPLTRAISNSPNVEMTHFCEVDTKVMDEGYEHCEEHLGYRPKGEKDLRRIMDNKDVDAIFIALPDHWHAPATWMALQAGKHVYVEKPSTHNPHEHELMVKYQKRYGKVIQVGNQQRSSVESQEIIREIHNGIIGDTYSAVAFYSNSRGELPAAKVMDPPPWLDWDLFQGPAPRRPFMNIYEDYNWHWNWHWGTAESGNNALHEVDIARWAMDVEYPEKVQALSGKFHFVDDPWEMYDTMEVTFYYPGNRTVKWDGKSRNGYSTYGAGRGTIIYGSEGSVWMDRDGYKLFDRQGQLVRERVSGSSEDGVALGGGGNLTTNHVRNFFASIRNGTKQNSTLAEGGISTQLCHYANISSRIGNQPVDIDTATGKLKDYSLMRDFWAREYEKGWEPPA